MQLRRRPTPRLAILGFAALLPLVAAAEAPRCPDDGALTLGPPAAELFDPHMPQAGEAIWCEIYDARGRATRVGSYSDQYPSGAPRSRAHFVADRLEGEVVILHENGRVWLHTRYHDGKIDGPYTLFSPSGAPWMSARYDDGVAEGQQITYFERGGKASETWYRAGVEHGLSRAWYVAGQLRQAIEVRDGRFDGEHVRWHPNGQLARAGRYVPCPPGEGSMTCEVLGSARHGAWQAFHPSGAIARREQWRFGRRVGPWFDFDPEGQLSSVTLMVDGLVEAPAQVANHATTVASTPN